MNFAKNAVNTIGSFVTNKAVLLGLGALLTTGAAMGQKGLKIMPTAPSKDTISMRHATSPFTGKDTTVVAKPQYKRTKAHKDNSFYAFNIGATYTPETSLWNGGAQFDWHGNVPGPGKHGSFMHRTTQFRAGYTMRNKQMGFKYNYLTSFGSASGGHYYRPNEVNAHLLIGPKIGIKGKNETYNRGVIFPYVGVGGSWGFGSSVNQVNRMSPETVEGIQIMVGRIGKTSKGKKKGEDKVLTSTVAISLFAEARQQHLNNWNIGGRAMNTIFAPNAGPNDRNTFRIGAHISLCRL